MPEERRLPGVEPLPDLVGFWRQRAGSAIAIGGLHEAVTFAELDAEASRWASALRQAGLEPGERVALWGENSSRWLARASGTWKVGLTLLPLSTFATPRELSELLDNAWP